MLSLSQAAKQTGKSKSVISRALENGKLPATKNESGTYAIDPVDLFTVFPRSTPEQNGTPVPTVFQNGEKNQKPEHQNGAEQAERWEQVAAERAQQAEDLRQTVSDLKRRLDSAESDRRRLESDRRQDSENSATHTEQLMQLIGMREKELQQHKLLLEHNPSEQQMERLQERLEQAEANAIEASKKLDIAQQKLNQPPQKRSLMSRIFI